MSRSLRVKIVAIIMRPYETATQNIAKKSEVLESVQCLPSSLVCAQQQYDESVEATDVALMTAREI